MTKLHIDIPLWELLLYLFSFSLYTKKKKKKKKARKYLVFISCATQMQNKNYMVQNSLQDMFSVMKLQIR